MDGEELGLQRPNPGCHCELGKGYNTNSRKQTELKAEGIQIVRDTESQCFACKSSPHFGFCKISTAEEAMNRAL